MDLAQKTKDPLRWMQHYLNTPTEELEQLLEEIASLPEEIETVVRQAQVLARLDQYEKALALLENRPHPLAVGRREVLSITHNYTVENALRIILLGEPKYFFGGRAEGVTWEGYLEGTMALYFAQGMAYTCVDRTLQARACYEKARCIADLGVGVGMSYELESLRAQSVISDESLLQGLKDFLAKTASVSLHLSAPVQSVIINSVIARAGNPGVESLIDHVKGEMNREALFCIVRAFNSKPAILPDLNENPLVVLSHAYQTTLQALKKRAHFQSDDAQELALKVKELKLPAFGQEFVGFWMKTLDHMATILIEDAKDWKLEALELMEDPFEKFMGSHVSLCRLLGAMSMMELYIHEQTTGETPTVSRDEVRAAYGVFLKHLDELGAALETFLMFVARACPNAAFALTYSGKCGSRMMKAFKGKNVALVSSVGILFGGVKLKRTDLENTVRMERQSVELVSKQSQALYRFREWIEGNNYPSVALDSDVKSLISILGFHTSFQVKM